VIAYAELKAIDHQLLNHGLFAGWGGKIPLSRDAVQPLPLVTVR